MNTFERLIGFVNNVIDFPFVQNISVTFITYIELVFIIIQKLICSQEHIYYRSSDVFVWIPNTLYLAVYVSLFLYSRQKIYLKYRQNMVFKYSILFSPTTEKQLELFFYETYYVFTPCPLLLWKSNHIEYNFVNTQHYRFENSITRRGKYS